MFMKIPVQTALFFEFHSKFKLIAEHTPHSFRPTAHASASAPESQPLSHLQRDDVRHRILHRAHRCR